MDPCTVVVMAFATPKCASAALLANIPLQWARSWAAHTASYVDRPSSAQSVLTSSNHLFFGLPTGLEPWILPNKEMYGSRSAFILQTCPKYDRRRCCTSSTTVLGKPRVILMSSFLHLSLLVTPNILLRIVISNTKSLLLSDSFNVHVSELYSSMERTSERYTLNFVSWVMSFDAQMVLRETEAPVARPILLLISFSELLSHPCTVASLFRGADGPNC